MPRKTKLLKSNITILLVVEGVTEQVYFSQLKYFERIQGVTVEPKMAQHSDIGHILDKAIKEYDSGAYDCVWCVFDTDVLFTTRVTKELKDKFLEAENRDINFADSFPAFEIWFLLHYAQPNSIYTNQKQVISELKKHISNYCKERKWLEKIKIYSLLKDKQQNAIDKARILELKNKNIKDENKTVCNVHKLIEDILNYKEKNDLK